MMTSIIQHRALAVAHSNFLTRASLSNNGTMENGLMTFLCTREFGFKAQ